MQFDYLVDEAYKQKETGTNSYWASKDCQSKITRERYLGTNGWGYVERVSNIINMIRCPFLCLPLLTQTKMALTFHFLNHILRKYIYKSTYIKKKNVDGDSRS